MKSMTWTRILRWMPSFALVLMGSMANIPASAQFGDWERPKIRLVPAEVIVGLAPLEHRSGAVFDPQFLANLMLEWTLDPELTQAFGSLLYLRPGCVAGDPGPVCSPHQEVSNGITEFHPNPEPIRAMLNPSVAGVTKWKAEGRVPAGLWGYVKFLTEADVFINTIDYDWIYASESRICDDQRWRNALTLRNTLIHEMGHLLGLGHDYGGGMMMSDGALSDPLCAEAETITESDWFYLKSVYLDHSGSIDIVRPQRSAIFFVGQDIEFLAAVRNLRGDLPAGSTVDDIVWESSINGVFGSGESLSTDQLLGGSHEITARIEGEDLLEGSTYIEVIDQVQTSLGDLAHPLPCVRTADRLGECVFTISESFKPGCSGPICSTCPTYSHRIRATNPQSGRSYRVIEPDYGFSGVGHGEVCRPHNTYGLTSAVIVDDPSPHVPLQFVHEYFASGRPALVHRVSGGLPIVEPLLEMTQTPPETCEIADGETHCGFSIAWEGHYFATGSGLFSRPLSGGAWSLVLRMGTTAGTLEVPAIVDTEGREFAVFQYSDDLGQSPQVISGPAIRAPAGLMAGPFQVVGRAQQGEADSFEVDDSAAQAKFYRAVPQNHNLFDAGDRDWVLYYAEAGRYIIETQGLGSNADTCLRLFRSNETATGTVGAPIASDCDSGQDGRGSRIVFDQPDDFAYYVEAFNENGSGGANTQYTLSISRETSSTPPDTWDDASDPDGNGHADDDVAARATHYVAVPQDHTFHDGGDRDWILYYSSPRALLIETSQLGANADTCLRVYRANANANGTSGGPVASNCDGGENGRGSRVVFNQPDAAAYFVEVWNQHGVGGVGTDYTLSVTTVTTDPDTWDDPADPDANDHGNDDVASRASAYRAVPQTHNFHDAGDRDWVLYYSDAAPLLIETTNLGFAADTCIRVFRSNATATGTAGSAVASDCDSGESGRGSRLIFHQPDNFAYYVEVWNQNGVSGANTDYTLSITRTGIDPDTWDAPGDIDGNGHVDDDVVGRATGYVAVPQEKNFHDSGDRDWIVYVSPPNTLIIETTNLGPSADTCIRLFRSNATATGTSGGPIATNCDSGEGGRGSRIVFNQPDNFVYFVEVWSENDIYGAGTEYTLSVTTN